jgi:hypothetical protein
MATCGILLIGVMILAFTPFLGSQILRILGQIILKAVLATQRIGNSVFFSLPHLCPIFVELPKQRFLFFFQASVQRRLNVIARAYEFSPIAVTYRELLNILLAIWVRSAQWWVHIGRAGCLLYLYTVNYRVDVSSCT